MIIETNEYGMAYTVYTFAEGSLWATILVETEEGIGEELDISSLIEYPDIIQIRQKYIKELHERLSY